MVFRIMLVNFLTKYILTVTFPLSDSFPREGTHGVSYFFLFFIMFFFLFSYFLVYLFFEETKFILIALTNTGTKSLNNMKT